MITIAIANQKGGTAKTTTAVTIATGLGCQHNYSTVLVDTDAQGHVALYLGLEPADSIFQLFVAEAPVAQCLTAVNGTDHLAIVRSGAKTSIAKVVLATQRAPVDILARALDPLRDVVDFCIIDTAPSVDPLGLATLYAADYVLIPTLCETLGLDGVRSVINTITDLRDTYNATTYLLGVLPTKYRKTTKEHYANLQTLTAAYGYLIFPPIPLATVVAESTAYQEPLWSYAPTHPATVAYSRVLERILANVKKTA